MTASLALDALPTAIIVALAGVFGALIGSFLNVVVWRVPRGLSVVSPPSACPQCEARIAWYDNIPVVSYLLLRGRCRNCGTHISMRYPLVETGTAIAFALLVFGALQGFLALAALPVLLYLASISIALGLIDLDTRRLPNSIVLPSYVVCTVLLVLASVLTGDYAALLRAAIGMAALFGFYFLMGALYRGGMGGGDIKLAGVLGMCLGWFGWAQLLVGAFAAFVVGGLISVVLLVRRKATRKSAIPFGPSMLVGAWVGILCGPAIAGWYVRLAGLA